MRPWLVLAALMLSAIAGCVSPPEEAGAAGIEATPAPAAAGPAPASKASASASPATPSPTGGAAPAEAAPEPIVLPLAYEGAFPLFVQPCVLTAVGGTCVPLSPGEFRNRYEVEAEGQATSLRVTLAWTPTSPLSEHLSLSFWSRGEDDLVVHGSAFGPSPLVLEIAEPFELPEGWTHVLGVGAPATGGYAMVAGAFVLASLEQPFALGGELTLAPPAAEASGAPPNP